MKVNALIFGSIGVLTETFDMQRQAFNRAFEEAGLDWHWDLPEYKEMLKHSGGRNRIERYATFRGEPVNADALHQSKVAHFGRLMADNGLQLRPGIRDLMDEAKNRAIPIAFATSTGENQSRALLENLGQQIDRDEFAFIGDASMVENGKPAPDIFRAALDALQVAPEEAIAIEDTPICAEAAVAAGIPTIGFPGEAAAGQDFPDGVKVVDKLTTDLLDSAELAHTA